MGKSILVIIVRIIGQNIKVLKRQPREEAGLARSCPRGWRGGPSRIGGSRSNVKAGPHGPSNLVVDVGRALRRHFLHDINWVAVVPTDLLIVWAEDAVSSPQGDDDVTGL